MAWFEWIRSRSAATAEAQDPNSKAGFTFSAPVLAQKRATELRERRRRVTGALSSVEPLIERWRAVNDGSRSRRNGSNRLSAPKQGAERDQLSAWMPAAGRLARDLWVGNGRHRFDCCGVEAYTRRDVEVRIGLGVTGGVPWPVR